MSSILISFAVGLKRYDISISPHGPLFHRWLPDGEVNQISLNLEGQRARLYLWFERRGYVEGSFIKYANDKQEVDETVMPRQGILDAGPLRGRLWVSGVPEKQVEALRAEREGDESYLALGKRLVKILQPQIARFLALLRANYGQFWLEPLEPWDSRNESLGSYCSGLHMRWSLDESQTWNRFKPTALELRGTVDLGAPYEEYIAEQDWSELAEVFVDGYSPSLGSRLIGRAHELLDTDERRFALIEASTAVEVALGEYIRRRFAGDEKLLKAVEAFYQMPTRSQIVALAAALPDVDTDDLSNAVDGLKLRHELVHEGSDPGPDSAKLTESMLRVASAFLDGPRHRFPIHNPGNELRLTAEDWEE